MNVISPTMKNLIILILFSFLTAQLSAQNYISINSNVNNVSCFGLSDASIVLDIVSSDPPYSIVWSNGATIDNLSFLPDGLYSVTITDSFQQVSETFEITQPDSIQISALVIDNM